MRPHDRVLAQQLDAGLLTFDEEKRPLLGIHDAMTREVLIEQLLKSIRRVEYVSVIRTRDISRRRADPNDEMFDPLKAAILCQRQGQIDEAFWFVFFFVHFGRHPRAGWRYAREIYGRLSDSVHWDWANTSADPSGFRRWLDNHQADLMRKGVPRGFGNHRKYQSLKAYSSNGTGAAFETYVRWVDPPRTHQQLMDQALERADGDPQEAFDDLYRSMATVASFGRLARFDYLTMIGKLGLASIEPGSTYMSNSTGPIRGARLLFAGTEEVNLGPATLDAWLLELGSQLNVGMQVLEDALCNWQKSPRRFKHFRG